MTLINITLDAGVGPHLVAKTNTKLLHKQGRIGLSSSP